MMKTLLVLLLLLFLAGCGMDSLTYEPEYTYKELSEWGRTCH